LASRSADQQAILLQKLEVIHAATDKIGGSSVRTEAIGNAVLSALDHMTSNSIPVTRIQELLVDRILGDSNQDLRPPAHHLTLSPRRRSQLEQRVLSMLHYPGMEDREGRIAEAFQQTFRWIYQDPPSEEHQWSNFRGWLESPSQLYWITGKAGSGKSTLMKYISSTKHDDGGCHQYLSRWAGNCRLILSRFYFWNSGYALQMTQEGLFRSLLHQSLSQAPGLIPSVCRPLWELLCLFDSTRGPTEREFREMLLLLARNLPDDHRLCLFVDGLDEFDGDHNMLVSLFRELLVQPNVKLCAASRPWVIFEDGFRASPSLQLEHLTYDDIRQFVNTKLGDDANFRVLRESEPDFANELVGNIVDKSSGVFLWVDLVVTSLLAGMGYGDRISDLQRRLNLLPPDLENLYEKILLSLDEFYLEHASQYLALVKASTEPIPVLMMSFIDEPFPDFVLKQPVDPLSEDNIATKVDTMRRRINSRCKGLLEVGRGPNQSRTVQYLHRTVRDYLESPQAASILGPANPHIDAALHLCAGYISILKILSHDDVVSSHFPELIVRCFVQARAVEPKNREMLFNLLDALDRTGAEHAKQLSRHLGGVETPQRDAVEALLGAGMWTFECPPSFQFWRELENPIDRLSSHTYAFGGCFLSVAVQCQVADYAVSRSSRACLVQRYVRPAYPMRSGVVEPIEVVRYSSTGRSVLWSLLYDAIPSIESERSFEPEIAFDATSVVMLLKHGADPNFQCRIQKDGEITTPWTKMLLLALWHCQRARLTKSGVLDHRDVDVTAREAEIRRATEAFVYHGAATLSPSKLVDMAVQTSIMSSRSFSSFTLHKNPQWLEWSGQKREWMMNILRTPAANLLRKQSWWDLLKM